MAHDREEVTRLAVLLLSLSRMEQRAFRRLMRAQHPGLSNWMLREATKDARLIIAIKSVNIKETEE